MSLGTSQATDDEPGRFLIRPLPTTAPVRMAAAKVPRGPGAPLIGRSFAARARQKRKAVGLSYGALRKECLEAVRQWPGCETVGGIQIIRSNTPVGFSGPGDSYGKADKKIADRAIICVQR